MLLDARSGLLILEAFSSGNNCCPVSLLPAGAQAHGAGSQHAVAAEHPHHHAGPRQGRDPPGHRDPHREDANGRRGPAGGGEATSVLGSMPAMGLTRLMEFLSTWTLGVERICFIPSSFLKL